MKKDDRIRSPFWALVFLAYCALMIYLLFFRGRIASEGIPYWEQVANNYNLRFGHTVQNFWDILARRDYYLEKWSLEYYHTHSRTALINLVGNVVMFVPFGAFLPAMWPGLQKFGKSVFAGFLSILAVEALQLFTLLGKCDVDDVLLNMLGIMAGYGLWRLCHKDHRGK